MEFELRTTALKQIMESRETQFFPLWLCWIAAVLGFAFFVVYLVCSDLCLIFNCLDGFKTASLVSQVMVFLVVFMIVSSLIYKGFLLSGRIHFGFGSLILISFVLFTFFSLGSFNWALTQPTMIFSQVEKMILELSFILFLLIDVATFGIEISL